MAPTLVRNDEWLDGEHLIEVILNIHELVRSKVEEILRDNSPFFRPGMLVKCRDEML